MGHRYMREWSGWIAAAACLGFGVYMFAGRFSTPATTVTAVSEGVAPPAQRAVLIPEPITGPVQRLAEDMTAQAIERLGRIFSGPSGDVVIVPIGKAAPEAGTGDEVTIGEVVWSRREGAGVVRLSNIKPSDSAGKNLQLWVFDSARGLKHPINAGVVPIRPGQTDVLVTLPIDADLRCRGVCCNPRTAGWVGGGRARQYGGRRLRRRGRGDGPTADLC
jgi:hypothetical protein